MKKIGDEMENAALIYPDNLGIVVLVGGVDVTDYVVPESLEITNVLTNQVDSCTFVLDGAPGSLIIADWMEVIVLDGGTKMFGGYLLSIDSSEGSDLLRRIECQCGDYSARLSHVRVSKEYINRSDAHIIADVFSTYMAGEGFDYTSHVEIIETHERLRYINRYIADVLRDLAKFSGGDWYVDENKNLHYFASQISTSPFGVSDFPDLSATFPYSNFRTNKDGSGIANRVRVIGGEYLSQKSSIYIRGNGTDKRLTLPARFRSGLRVWRNDGNDYEPIWRPLTVSAGYVTDLVSPDAVLYFYQEKTLEAMHAWPQLNKACKVLGVYEVPSPLIAEETDAASYAFYGKYFDEIIIDSGIVEQSAARMRAKSRLAEASMAKIVISFETRQPGLRAGQLLPVVNALQNINGQYLIQRVTTTVGIDGAARYSVDCGIYNPDLIDYLLLLSKSKNKADEESTYDLLNQVEMLALNDAAEAAASSSPYTWNSFNWDFGVWS